MAVLAQGDLFGKHQSIWMYRNFEPLIMAEQAHGNLLRVRRQGSIWVDPAIMTVTAVSARRLRSARDLKVHMLYAGHGGLNIHMSSASTASEAIASLEHRQQQGIIIDWHTFVQVLKLCSKQKDLIATRRVNDCIIQSGMDKHPYVANTLLSAYVRCERLQDARRLFDGLEKKDDFTWNIMIGGYANNDHVEDALELFNRNRRRGAQPDELLCLSILKACAGPLALKWGRQLHAYIRHAGLESDVRVGTALVQMYAKCACITEARRVFENLTNRDVITWNAMIGAYAKSGFGGEAYRMFLQMKREGFIPNAITYLSILNASASGGALEWVKAVHSDALKAGLESDLRVGNAFVHMYAKSGSIDLARVIFDRLKTRNVMTWTIMIGAYAENGCGAEAYGLFIQMQQEGFKPDGYTYASILNASATEGPLEWVKVVHAHARRAGLESDLRVGNALVHMYAKSGSFDDARLIFNRMEKRDAFTWTAILKACASPLALNWGKELHADIRHARLESDVRVGTALVQMYAKCGCITEARRVYEQLPNGDVIRLSVMIDAYAESGRMDDARLLFDRTENRDVIAWNTIIGAYAKTGRGVEAYQLFLEMKREGFVPNAITYLSILSASASAGALEWVKAVQSDALKAGLESDVRVGNALIHMYANIGSIDHARVTFNRLKRRDVTTWNIMIGAHAESDCGREGYRLFLQMQREGFKPNAYTYTSILNAPASVGALEWVKEVHGHALKAGLESDLRVGNALVLMYAKCGRIRDARVIFNRLKIRDVTTWNIMIGAYAKSGCGVEAYGLFLQMKQEGFIPDAITCTSILNASASAGALDWVKEVHSHARVAGLESDLRLGGALAHMYAKIGSIDDARLVFNRMEKRDVVSWNIMIGGLAQHGCGHEALELFRKMNVDGVKPDGGSFVAVLQACCHAGLVDDGRRLFLAMAQDYGVEPDVLHYTCMVDLLGRAGQLEEAKLLIGDMPVAPDAVTWKALLGACRSYGNVELGELAAQEVLMLDPKDTSAYVLLSNIYAAAGKWEKVSLVRTMMKQRGVRKEPGRSWIEVDSRIHEFVVGDKSHPESKAIYAELNKLTENLKTEGYIPDTQLVLHDIDEEDKELALCSHSEKLAITYGLLRIPRGTPIRVYKNLRVCSDCHTATKFISKVTGREIIARDVNRFHHFKDGVCSCGDYW